jgi:hypothetical protein
VCFMRARAQLPEPRPGFVAIRSMLLHDSFHREAVGVGSAREPRVER